MQDQHILYQIKCKDHFQHFIVTINLFSQIFRSFQITIQKVQAWSVLNLFDYKIPYMHVFPKDKKIVTVSSQDHHNPKPLNLISLRGYLRG